MLRRFLPILSFILIGLFAFGVRVVTGEILKPIEHHGTLTTAYFTYANNLIDRGTYSGEADSTPPDSFRPPAYPFFLAGIRLVSGRDQWENWVAFIQYTLGALACVLVAHIGCQVVSFRAGIIAGWLSVFYLDFVYITIPFLRETLSVFLLLGMLDSFLLFLRDKKPGWLFLSAGVFGVAILSRPEIVLVGILLIALYYKELLQALSLKKMGLVLVLALLPWSAWVARNYRLHHQFVPFSTEGAWAFFMGQVFHPDVAVPDGDKRAIQIIEEGPTEMDWYRRMMEEGKQAILDHPLRAVLWIGPKLRITFKEYAAHDTGLLFPLLAVLVPWFSFDDPIKRRAFTAAGAVVATGILLFGTWDRSAPINLFHVSYTEVVCLAAVGFFLMTMNKKSGEGKALLAPFLALIMCNALTTSHLRQRVVLGDWVLMIWAAYLISLPFEWKIKSL